MRLGFHYHIPAIQKEGKILMPGYLGLFIDSIAVYCDQLVCFQHSPLQQEVDQMDYTLKSKNVRLVGIGPHNPIPIRTYQALREKNLYEDWQDKLDVMLVRASTPLLPVIANVWKKPMVLLLVSDAAAGVENLPQPFWRKKLIKIYADWYNHRQLKIAQNCLTFSNSQLIYDELKDKVPELILTRTTTLSQHDFYEKEDTCQNEVIKLLYAGRMTRIKGLFEIIDAMETLTKEGYNLHFDLVGMLDESDPMMDDLMEYAKDRGLDNKVIYHGSKTAGGDLLDYYRNADVYVMASKASSEGFPRTIWEAMASSLPVVATSVGSIPMYAGHACELVEPKNIDSLTKGIRTVITEPLRRKTMIIEGMKLAKDNTLEKRGLELISQIKDWMQKKTEKITKATVL